MVLIHVFLIKIEIRPERKFRRLVKISGAIHKPSMEVVAHHRGHAVAAFFSALYPADSGAGGFRASWSSKFRLVSSYPHSVDASATENSNTHPEFL